MGIIRHLLALIATLVVGAPTVAQSLFLAPSQTVDDQIGFLLGERRSAKPALEIRGVLGADNNIEDFARAGESHPPTNYSFIGARAYYAQDTSADIGLTRGQWEIRYSSVTSDYYHGNHDTAQIYLDSLSGASLVTGVYNPRIAMSRSSGDRYRVSYTTPVKLGVHPALIMAAANYYRFGMVDLGSLQGSAVNGNLTGTLNLESTVGLPSSQVNSQAATLDAGISVEAMRSLRVSLTVENLAGHLWESNVQNVVAAVSTSNVTVSQDGIISAPFLSGKVTKESIDCGVVSRSDFGLAYRERYVDFIGMVAHDYDWTTALGANFRLSRGDHAWFLLYPEPFEWCVGARFHRFVLQLGLSSIDFGTTRRVHAELGYSIPL